MRNEIADRIAFFMKDYPPFSYLEYSDLEKLASEVTVRFLEEKETLFNESSNGNDCCYVLRKGNIKLSQKQNGEIVLLDQCEPGDVFGVRSILSGNNYVMSADCEEESLVYEIPKSVFLDQLNSNQQFSFFFASGYAAGQAIARSERGKNMAEFDAPEQPVYFAKELLTCNRNTLIQEAAQMMRHHHVGSIIVIENELPVGIVTDTDLRNKVVAGNVSSLERIDRIMSAPVKTIDPKFSYSEVLIKMIRSKSHHLVVTDNGTNHSKAIGIVSDHDIMIAQNNLPSALIKRLRKEKNPSRWAGIRDQAQNIVADYIDKELSVELISSFITEVNDILTKKAIKFALEKVPEAKKIDFAWLSLGSEGREEQLLRTDQDNAIIFSDDFPDAQPILLELAEIVNLMLVGAGFEECPANIMARNQEFCLSLSQWKKKFSHWINNPDSKSILNSTIFFDFREVYGKAILTENLQLFLVDEIENAKIFLNHLAANALKNPPPLSFFKKFLVEKNGEHVDQFDIKKRAMMPLSDIARVLMLQYRVIDVQNTSDRYKKLSRIDSKNKEFYDEAALSYQMMMRIRAKYGLKNKDSGRYIDIEEMNKLEKQILRSAFAPIKELQDMMETRFQLAYFR